jgi:chloramphenicol 3-O phosphotransferase
MLRLVATIVVLNGSSSSGKTSVARAFQEVAPTLFLNVSIDSILYALPPDVLERMKRGEPQQREIRFLELVRAFCACVRELAALGHDLVIDHAVMTAAEAELIENAVASHRTLFVGLQCPADVLTERERARGDRRPGLAASQCERVHQWFDYDLVIDTAAVSAGEAARRIVAALTSSARG